VQSVTTSVRGSSEACYPIRTLIMPSGASQQRGRIHRRQQRLVHVGAHAHAALARDVQQLLALARRQQRARARQPVQPQRLAPARSSYRRVSYISFVLSGARGNSTLPDPSHHTKRARASHGPGPFLAPPHQPLQGATAGHAPLPGRPPQCLASRYACQAGVFFFFFFFFRQRLQAAPSRRGLRLGGRSAPAHTLALLTTSKSHTMSRTCLIHMGEAGWGANWGGIVIMIHD